MFASETEKYEMIRIDITTQTHLCVVEILLLITNTFRNFKRV